MFTNYPMLPTCNRKLRQSCTLLLYLMQCSIAFLSHGKIHTDTHPCAWVSWQGSQATERSLEVLKFVGGKSSLQQSTNAACPALPQLAFGTRDKHLGRTMWKCNPLPLTCQKPGDAIMSKIKLSSSCLLVLYCTSFACCYSKNRIDSSSEGTTTVSKTTQANSLLNICSL